MIEALRRASGVALVMTICVTTAAGEAQEANHEADSVVGSDADEGMSKPNGAVGDLPT